MYVCSGAHICVKKKKRQSEREKEEERGKEKGWRKKDRPKNSLWHSWCLNVLFFTSSSSFFPPLQFSWRQGIDFILGLSYHLAAFHSSVFIKQGEQRKRERERSKETGHKIHYALNKDSERKGSIQSSVCMCVRQRYSVSVL